MIGQAERLNIKDLAVDEPVVEIDLEIDRDKLLSRWHLNFNPEFYALTSWNPMEKRDFQSAICVKVLTDATSEELGLDEEIWKYELKRFEKLKRETEGSAKFYSLVSSIAILFPEKVGGLDFKREGIQIDREMDFGRKLEIEDLFNVCVSVSELLKTNAVTTYSEPVTIVASKLRQLGLWGDYEVVASRAKFLFPESFEAPNLNKKEITQINKRLDTDDFDEYVRVAASWHVILSDSARITENGLVITPRKEIFPDGQKVAHLPAKRSF